MTNRCKIWIDFGSVFFKFFIRFGRHFGSQNRWKTQINDVKKTSDFKTVLEWRTPGIGPRDVVRQGSLAAPCMSRPIVPKNKSTYRYLKNVHFAAALLQFLWFSRFPVTSLFGPIFFRFFIDVSPFSNKNQYEICEKTHTHIFKPFFSPILVDFASKMVPGLYTIARVGPPWRLSGAGWRYLGSSSPIRVGF